MRLNARVRSLGDESRSSVQSMSRQTRCSYVQRFLPVMGGIARDQRRIELVRVRREVKTETPQRSES